MCSSLQITYSVPFSVTAELTAGTGGGQGSSCYFISPSTCLHFVGPYFDGLLLLICRFGHWGSKSGDRRSSGPYSSYAQKKIFVPLKA